MRTRRSLGWLCLATLLAAGCRKGSVKMSEVEPFGPIRSALWVEVYSYSNYWGYDTYYRDDYSSYYDTSRYDGGYYYYNYSGDNYFLMSNRVGLCRHLRQAYQDLADIRVQEEYEGAYEPPVSIDECTARVEAAKQYAESTQQLFVKNSNYIRVDLDRNQYGYTTDRPQAGTYEADANQGSSYSGRVSMFHSNPFDFSADAASCVEYTDDASTAATAVAMDEAVDTYEVGTGRLNLQQPRWGAFKLSMDGQLVGENGESMGEIALKAKAKRCFIEVSMAEEFVF
jgi:hypothetical protein